MTGIRKRSSNPTGDQKRAKELEPQITALRKVASRKDAEVFSQSLEPGVGRFDVTPKMRRTMDVRDRATKSADGLAKPRKKRKK